MYIHIYNEFHTWICVANYLNSPSCHLLNLFMTLQIRHFYLNLIGTTRNESEQSKKIITILQPITNYI